MHGSSSGSGPGKKARIEIIPLIDVIFFLLATFVLFTISLNKSEGLPVSLPSVATSEGRDPSNSVTISVTAEGTIAWGKEQVDLAEFLQRLTSYKASTPEPKVFINGDERALFSQAVYVFDEVRKARIDKVFIETRVLSAPTTN